jgi:hypothetical protein
VARLGAVVVGMGLAALVVAYLGFGWPVLLVGVPALVAVALVVLAVLAWEGLVEQRAARVDEGARLEDCPLEGAQLSGGLMSGFFELSAPQVSSERDPHRP